MRYLLDSDWCIDALSGDSGAVSLIHRLMGEGVVMSIITYMESYQTVLRSPSLRDATERFEAFIATIPVVPLSEAVARRCARLREDLRHAGKRVRPWALDLIIGGTALEYDLALVTRNTYDYDDIPGLTLSSTS